MRTCHFDTANDQPVAVNADRVTRVERHTAEETKIVFGPGDYVIVKCTFMKAVEELTEWSGS